MRRIIITLFLMLAGSIYSSSFAKAFNANQVSEIEQIVHQYLIENPEVLIEVSESLQRKEQERSLAQASEAIAENITPLFNDPISPIDGNPDGAVTIIEFLDYQCVYCKRMVPVITDLTEKNANLRVVYKEWPIFGEVSEFAARATLAANKQGNHLYQALHKALMEFNERLSEESILALAESVGLNTTQLQTDMQNEAITQELLNNRILAGELGIQGTPAFIVGTTPDASGQQTRTDNFFIPGGVPQEHLQAAIDELS